MAWLFNSGKLDFSLLKSSLQYKGAWALSLLLTFANLAIGTLRWKYLLEAKSNIKLKFLAVLRVQWIGLLFNTVLPGAVTGDLIKLLYARDLDKKLDKMFLLASVLLDRILGLFGFICILGISGAIYYNDLSQKAPDIRHLIHFNFVLFFFLMVFFLFMFMPQTGQNKMVELMEKIPRLGPKLARPFQEIWVLGSGKRRILVTVLISMLSQICNIIAFWNLAAHFFPHHVPLKYAFTFIPIGLISIAIPITPAGLGVGHLVFDKLFMYFQVPKGASLFNFYFILATIANIIGIVPYLMSGKKHTLKETAEI